MKNKTILLAFLTISSVFLSQIVLANLPPEPPAEPVPIDGGLSLLLVAGAALGGKKVWNARQKKITN